MWLLIFGFWVRNSKCNFSFFNFKLVTRKYKTKSLIFELVIKFSLIFYEADPVTRKNNSYKTFRVSNLKCEVILCNSVTREFWTSTDFLKSEIIQRSASVQEITRINTTISKKMNLKNIKNSLYISSVVLQLSLWFRLNSFFSLVLFLPESTKE